LHLYAKKRPAVPPSEGKKKKERRKARNRKSKPAQLEKLRRFKIEGG